MSPVELHESSLRIKVVLNFGKSFDRIEFFWDISVFKYIESNSNRSLDVKKFAENLHLLSKIKNYSS